MAIIKPTLPAIRGYVEVEVDGERKYRNAITGILMEDEPVSAPEPELTEMDKLAAAYLEGVNEA